MFPFPLNVIIKTSITLIKYVWAGSYQLTADLSLSRRLARSRMDILWYEVNIVWLLASVLPANHSAYNG